jgi:hypothetical protein
MTPFVIRAVCFIAAVCACFGQDDHANIHVPPRGGEQSLTSADRSPDRKNGPVRVDVDLVLATRSALIGFLHWMLGAGQRQASALGYLPLPKDVAIKEEAAIARIH